MIVIFLKFVVVMFYYNKVKFYSFRVPCPLLIADGLCIIVKYFSDLEFTFQLLIKGVIVEIPDV